MLDYPPVHSMLELSFEPIQDSGTIRVQDEPALEIALPEVCIQPELTMLQRGKLPNVETAAIELAQRHLADPASLLGSDYQELVNEFQPLFTWAIACWDYLLSTEGCRFLPRQGEQRYGMRGDYRAVTDKDFSRLIHKLFRTCVFEFANAKSQASLTNGHASEPHEPPRLGPWLRQRFWPLVRETYRRLEQPADLRQRILTPYSYLRCVPYHFLNDFHHELVYTTAQRLPILEWRAIDAYFFHFYTEVASAQAMGCSVEESMGWLRQAMIKLLLRDRLVYCLLRQIERY